MHTKISTIDGRRRNFTLPVGLTNRISQLAKESDMKLTQLIKIALEEFLAKKEKEKLEKQIIEGCKTYYDQDKETAGNWVVAEAKFKSNPIFESAFIHSRPEIEGSLVIPQQE